MLRDNPMFKKMIATGEERVGKIATQLLSNEKLMGALQKTVSAALEAKGLVERNVQSVLSTMNIPTANDVQRLQGKIDELERVFEGLSAKIAELQKREAGAAPPPPN
ncbi:MAG TPA: phasin family protein [Myxococcales bacterium]|jgi:polyhydroxyalkanoate synthesis regulator phasin|nr:phasin family protein [Myxococcales bacterium]